ncbi:MAG: NADH:ubiquinone reductase (Na(+)-transporting) subunit A, partial [Planctomycetota bacterium]
MIRIQKGLNLPLAGEPSSDVEAGPAVKHVGLLGDDYVGMKPTMLVREGERVKLGQPLFADKKNPGVQFTAPGAGTVKSIVRGEKRKFESISIELDGDEEETFAQYDAGAIGGLERAKVQENLVASGLWTAFRTRPYSRTPALDTAPHSIFVTAMDTRPHAPNPVPLIKEREADFTAGLKTIAQLTDGPVQLCRQAGQNFQVGEATPRDFDGPHPAGLPGTHIHFIAPVSEQRTVWYIGYQDVIAIGHLFTTGRLDTTRLVALSGPVVKRPRLVRTRLGACISELTANEVEEGAVRRISGSVLDGRTADEARDYLGRFHCQVSVISDEVPQPLLGWLA